MSRFAAFAVGVVLISATDFELFAPEAPELPPICAKSEAVCETAARAVRSGFWRIEPQYTACRRAAAPCFSPESLCIVGFNCEGDRR